MKCPYCGFDDDRVIDSRPAKDGDAIRRRRECTRCERRYTTFEEVEERRLFVVKKDGRREPFKRDKVLASMEIACRKRQVPTAILNTAAEEIERTFAEKYEQEIPSRVLGNLVLRKLRKIDPVAYIRFASVYKEFEDPEEFQEIISSLSNRKKKTQSELNELEATRSSAR